MEKRINKKINNYITESKNLIRESIHKTIKNLESDFNTFDNKSEITSIYHNRLSELMSNLFSDNQLVLEKEDFQKRKRVKNTVPCLDRCCAKRANGERCTRRRKHEEENEGNDQNQFCGTHIKGTPHGVISVDLSTLPKLNTKIEVWVKDIKGINYYIDDNNNVYNPEDILSNKQNPSIIAKWLKTSENVYSIPEFGI